MSNQPSTATLVLSIDLKQSSTDGLPGGEEFLSSVDALLKLLRDAKAPATWASTDPTASRAVAEVLAEPVGHEIACRTDVSAAALSIRPLREINRQIERAARAGYLLRTLAGDAAPCCEVLQGAARSGITTVLTRGKSEPRGGVLRRLMGSLILPAKLVAGPRLLRYGVWEVPPPVGLTSRGGGQAALLRCLNQTVAAKQVLHVNIDIAQLAASGAGGLKRIEALLRTAVELRGQRRLALCTAAEFIDKLRMLRNSTPARSILRQAA